MSFKNVSISDFKKISPEELAKGESFNVTSNSEFIGMFIVPPSGYLKMMIEDRVCEAERATGVRKE